jgi:hypothetical protein
VGFVFLVDVLWGSVYYVSGVAERAVTFDSVVRLLTVPALVVSVVGLLGTGLVLLMVVRWGCPGVIRGPARSTLSAFS